MRGGCRGRRHLREKKVRFSVVISAARTGTAPVELPVPQAKHDDVREPVVVMANEQRPRLIPAHLQSAKCITRQFIEEHKPMAGAVPGQHRVIILDIGDM